MLALLIDCGLRRSELVAVEVATIQQREGRWVLVDIAGKRHRLRSVPMSAWAKAAIDQWTLAGGIGAGWLLRGISQKGEIGEGMSALETAGTTAHTR